MLVGSRTALVFALLVAAAGCPKRDLQMGSGQIALDGGRADGAGTSDVIPGGGADRTLPPPPDGSLLPTDAAESACVSAAVLLPWMKPSSTIARLDVVTAGDTVAVMNRTPDMLDVRTYGRDGVAIAGFQFASDAQFLPYRDGRYLLVAHGVTGAFNATAIDPDLVGGTRLYAAASSATEHVRAAIPLASSTVLITDERFVNVGADRAAAWSSVLGAADADTFVASNVYGIAAQSDRVLIAWGTNDTLRLAVLDTNGALVARADHAGFFDSVGSYTASAVPWDDGLLVFDRNPVRVTHIGFDLTRTTLGSNAQLETFYRVAPRVAALNLFGGSGPVAFWMTVYPETDNTQGATTHQLYGCALDLAAPSTCRATALIAATGLSGYTIPEEPVAAAGFDDGRSFAIAHTDVNGRSWLRIANLACGIVPDAGP